MVGHTANKRPPAAAKGSDSKIVFADLISDAAVFAGMLLIAIGLYYLAVLAIDASRSHDDRIISGEADRGRQHWRPRKRR
jgi:hypothetical protein